MSDDQTNGRVEDELARLAATRAAIDPKRRSTRRDIVVNAAIGHLATNDKLSTESLRNALATVFRTQAVTIVELEEALRGAQQAHLVEAVSGPNGEERWQATAGVIAEASQDREWAASVLSRLGDDVTARLDELGHSLTPTQASKVVHEFIRILAAGCNIAANGQNLGADHLRPLDFNRQAISEALRRLEPAQYREAMHDLLDASCDPDDPFGVEIVHYLIVSSVLICYIKKQDLRVTPTLRDTRLLLDTQVLVQLVDGGTPEQAVVRSLVKLTKDLGGEVYVAEHSIEEWGRLWEGADQEKPDAVTDALLFEAASRLTQNPFIGQFLRARSTDTTLKWRRFQISRSNVMGILNELGVVVRAHGNHTTEDMEIVDRVIEEMKDTRGPHGRPRSRASINADAQSAAMIARWRKRTGGGMCSAYFISADSSTGRAYQHVAIDDQTPLTIRPGAWLMYAAYLTGDESELADMADIVSSAAVRQSFFGIATAYTLEEIVKLSEMLREDHHAMSLEESREAAQLDLNQLLTNPDAMNREGVVMAVGAEILQRRSARRDARAKRAERLAVEAKVNLDSIAAVALGRAERAEEERSRIREELDQTKSARVGETAKLWRLVRAIAIAAVLLTALVGLWVGGAIRGWGIPVAILGAIWYAVAGVKYVTSTTSGKELILGSLGDSVAIVLAWVLGRIH